MIQPGHSRFEEDPSELDLPPLDPLEELEKLETNELAGEENFQPEDDSDFGLGQDDAPIGLDVSVGPDEFDESGGLSADEREGESWLDAGETRAGVAQDEDDLGEEDAGSWTDGSEAPAANPDDFSDEISLEEDGAAEEDSGQEGFRDESALLDGDVERLPPLDDASATDADDDRELELFAGEFLEELAARSPERRDDARAELDAPSSVAAALTVEVLSEPPRHLRESYEPVTDGLAILDAEALGYAVELRLSRHGRWVLSRLASPADMPLALYELPVAWGEPLRISLGERAEAAVLYIACERAAIRIVLPPSTPRHLV